MSNKNSVNQGNSKVTPNMRTLCDYFGIDHANKAQIYMRCPDPNCGTSQKSTKLNINFQKDIFRCNKCSEAGRVGKLFKFISTKKPVPADQLESVLVKEFIQELNKKGQDIIEYDNSFIPEESPIASDEARDLAYQELLKSTTLTQDHRESLHTVRGLDDAAIERYGYRTAPISNMECSRIAHNIRWKKGIELDGVPGFFTPQKDDDEWIISSSRPSILIPIRGLKGNIQAFQVRKDTVKTGENRFGYLTSVGKENGTSAKTFAHFVGYPERVIYLTEGPMKADIINFYINKPVIAIPGVNSRTLALEMLKELYELGSRHVEICFDMDMYTNKYVMDALKKLVVELTELGFTHKVKQWDQNYKGYDDYLKHIHDMKNKKTQ